MNNLSTIISRCFFFWQTVNDTFYSTIKDCSSPIMVLFELKLIRSQLYINCVVDLVNLDF